MAKNYVDVLIRDLNGNTVGRGEVLFTEQVQQGQEFRVIEALLVEPGGTRCPGTLRLTIELDYSEEES